MTALETFRETDVEIPRIKHGKKQTIETLIREEAQLFAECLRTKNKEWKPRNALLVAAY